MNYRITKYLLVLFTILFLTACAPNNGNEEYLKAGQDLVATGSYNAALKQFLTGIKNNPENQEYYLSTADIYLKKGDEEKAIEVLTEGFGKTTSAVVASSLGDLYLGSGNLEEADKWYTQSVSIDEKNLEAIKGRVKLHSLNYDEKEAIKVLDSFPSESYDSELYLMKAVLSLDEPSEATKYTTLSVTKGDDSVNLATELNKAIAIYGKDQTVHNLSEIAFILLNSGWFELANIPVTKSINDNQFYETGYIYRGLINLNVNRLDEALENFSRAEEINPESIDSQIFLIQTDFLSDNEESAILRVEKLLDNKADLTPKQFISLVEILYKNNEVKLIDKMFDIYKDLEIPTIETSVLIEALIELERYQQAELMATEALESGDVITNPLSARLSTLKGYAQFNLNKKQAGLEAMEKSIRIDSTQPIVHYYYGRALLENGETERALESFEKAIDVDLEGLVTEQTQELLSEI